MWRLKLSQGDGVTSTNNHTGRQLWEYDSNDGTDEERALVENARKEFYENRYETKHSSDLLMRIQVQVILH